MKMSYFPSDLNMDVRKALICNTICFHAPQQTWNKQKCCIAHIVVQGLQGLQINYGVVQVQDGLKRDRGTGHRSETININS